MSNANCFYDEVSPHKGMSSWPNPSFVLFTVPGHIHSFVRYLGGHRSTQRPSSFRDGPSRDFYCHIRYWYHIRNADRSLEVPCWILCKSLTTVDNLIQVSLLIQPVTSAPAQ